MQALISGTVVDVEKRDWTYNGNSGTSFSIFVRSGRERDGAQKIKVQPEQYGRFAVGQNFDDDLLPVDIYARASDNGGQARLDVVLDRDYGSVESGIRAAS